MLGENEVYVQGTDEMPGGWTNETHKPHSDSESVFADEIKDGDDSFVDLTRSKYHREIKPGVWVDIYDVLNAFDPDNRNAADDHAIKKMLLPGKRGVKDGVKDREEAIKSLVRSLELVK